MDKMYKEKGEWLGCLYRARVGTWYHRHRENDVFNLFSPIRHLLRTARVCWREKEHDQLLDYAEKGLNRY